MEAVDADMESLVLELAPLTEKLVPGHIYDTWEKPDDGIVYDNYGVIWTTKRTETEKHLDATYQGGFEHVVDRLKHMTYDEIVKTLKNTGVSPRLAGPAARGFSQALRQRADAQFVLVLIVKEDDEPIKAECDLLYTRAQEYGAIVLRRSATDVSGEVARISQALGGWAFGQLCFYVCTHGCKEIGGRRTDGVWLQESGHALILSDSHDVEKSVSTSLRAGVTFVFDACREVVRAWGEHHEKLCLILRQILNLLAWRQFSDSKLRSYASEAVLLLQSVVDGVSEPKHRLAQSCIETLKQIEEGCSGTADWTALCKVFAFENEINFRNPTTPRSAAAAPAPRRWLTTKDSSLYAASSGGLAIGGGYDLAGQLRGPCTWHQFRARLDRTASSNEAWRSAESKSWTRTLIYPAPFSYSGMC